jgi:hypothetical protein
MLIFKVKVKVLYFCLQNFDNLSPIFHKSTMAMAAMNMVTAGRFSGGKISFKKLSAGGRLCTLQEKPPIWSPDDQS